MERNDLIMNQLKEENERRLKILRCVSLYLRNLGVPAYLRGYRYLREAIAMKIEDNRQRYLTREVYPQIAQKYGTDASAVERSMRHAIEVSWSRADTELVSKVFAYHLARRRSKPANGEYISQVADYILIFEDEFRSVSENRKCM